MGANQQIFVNRRKNDGVSIWDHHDNDMEWSLCMTRCFSSLLKEMMRVGLNSGRRTILDLAGCSFWSYFQIGFYRMGESNGNQGKVMLVIIIVSYREPL